MIVFDLSCPDAHRFEGWFRSTEDFRDQTDRGLVACPVCGSVQVRKEVTAAAVPKKGGARPDPAPPNAPVPAAPAGSAVSPKLRPETPGLPPALAEAMKALAKVQAAAIRNSDWVGEDFARQSREMHYGDRDERQIHGRATAKEARELLDEGIAVAPLLIPIVPPDERN